MFIFTIQAATDSYTQMDIYLKCVYNILHLSSIMYGFCTLDGPLRLKPILRKHGIASRVLLIFGCLLGPLDGVEVFVVGKTLGKPVR